MPKVSVAYATRAGSTAEVAERVGQRLCAQGLSAEGRTVEEVLDLAGYDASVLGSRTCYASWLGPMASFVQAQAEGLRRIPVAFFACRVDPSRLSFLDRLAVRLVRSPLGDRRDWGRIEAWFDAFAPKLSPT